MNLAFNDDIKKDFKKNWFVISVLFIGMIPFLLNGYGQYILILLLPFTLKRWNITTLFTIIFGIFYELGILSGGIEQTPANIVFNVFFPYILYQTGVYLSYNIRDKKTLIAVYTIVVICLSSTAIYEIFRDSMETGQIISISRRIYKADGSTHNATQYGMMLSCALSMFGLTVVKTHNKYDRTIKILLLSVCFLSVWGTIYLLNRTGLVLCFISIFVSLILQKGERTKRIKIFVITLILGGIAFYFLSQTEFYQLAVESYEYREEKGYEGASLGGRDVRYMAGIQQMLENPLGGSNGIHFDGSDTYAHNMWIDAGLKGGILSMLVVIYFSYKLVETVNLLRRRRGFDNFELMVIILLTFIILIQAMVEPVIDGLPQLFWFMLFVMGSLKRFAMTRNVRELPKQSVVNI